MICAVIGEPGVGKGALMTKFVYDCFVNEGQDIFDNCCNEIDELNISRRNKLSYPDKVPIFTDFKVTLPAGYQKEYTTYFTNGFYVGLSNSDLPVLFMPPHSRIFLTEVQRYYDSRKSSSLPDWVSRFYEMHRHFKYVIYLDLQRYSLLDLNIRDLAHKFILIDKPLKLVLDNDGLIKQCIWSCKEFSSVKDVDLYYETKAETFTNVEYSFDGNIFDLYDSYSNYDKFIPGENEDFSYLEHGGKSNGKFDYYDFSQPTNYRLNKNEKNRIIKH
ncbi:MAG: hypothetical protein IJF75_03000 [Clostridia bacterium]|nr:hypothetical protein [Clostridia bacterium]MBQ4122490.1 hypothetical protein [bacterium]